VILKAKLQFCQTLNCVFKNHFFQIVHFKIAILKSHFFKSQTQTDPKKGKYQGK